MDNVQKTFMDGYLKLKQRIGLLEKGVKERDKMINNQEAEIKELNRAVDDVNKGLNIWKETADNRTTIFEEYKNKERTGFEMMVKSVVDYMDRYELYRETVNRYAGAVLQAFRGLNQKQKDKFNTYIKKKTIEVENYAKRLKEGKL